MLLDVLGFRQSDDSRCGVASIKSVLYYYGIDATEDDIAVHCNHSYELGCTNEDMVKALQHYGLGAKLIFGGTIADLRYWNRHRVPVIVDWFTPGITGEHMPNGHSSIVVDVDRHDVYLLDPENGKVRQIPHIDFERVWFDYCCTEVITPDTELYLGAMIITYPKRLEI